jgi:hypothetical protein
VRTDLPEIYLEDLLDALSKTSWATLRRYAFLSGYSARNDAEQAEMEHLWEELCVAGVDPGWEVVPRSTEDDISVFLAKEK